VGRNDRREREKVEEMMRRDAKRYVRNAGLLRKRYEKKLVQKTYRKRAKKV